MEQPLARELEREAARLAAEATAERAGGDGGEQPLAHEPLKHRRVALKGGAALGVGEHDALPGALQLQQELVEVRGHGGEGGLHQQPRPAAEA